MVALISNLSADSSFYFVKALSISKSALLSGLHVGNMLVKRPWSMNARLMSVNFPKLVLCEIFLLRSHRLVMSKTLLFEKDYYLISNVVDVFQLILCIGSQKLVLKQELVE